MQDADSPGQSLSPSGKQRSHAEMAGKTADMQSDGGTQTEDVGRTEQDACMGYNHVYLAVNLAGRGTGGRSPVFQGAHLNPMFPDGLGHVPFFPATPAMQKAGCGTVPGFYMPVEGGDWPTPWSHLESLGATLVLSWYTQVMSQCCLTEP